VLQKSTVKRQRKHPKSQSLQDRAYTPAQRCAAPNRANKIVWSQLPRGTICLDHPPISFLQPPSHLCRLDNPFKPRTSQIKHRRFNRSLRRGCRPESGVSRRGRSTFGPSPLILCRAWCAGSLFSLGPTTKLNRLHHGQPGLRTCGGAASRRNMCHDTGDGHVGYALILLE
jgi:hypothetical protein